MTILSRIFPARQRDESTVKPWQLPQFDGRSGPLADGASVPGHATPDAANSPSIDGEVSEEHSRGYQDGLQLAEQQSAQHLEQLKSLIQGLENPAQALTETVATEIVELAIEISRQILKHEFELSPDNLNSLIETALQQMPDGSQETVISLNSSDAELFNKSLNASDAGNIQLKIDASLENGNFVLKRGRSVIQGGLDAMLQSVAARFESTSDAQV